MESCIYQQASGALPEISFIRALPKVTLPLGQSVPCRRFGGTIKGVREPKSMTDKPPVVLTIAGFDPSSGAGVTADIKTIAAHGCYGVAALSALTVQSTTGVTRTQPSDVALLRETLDELNNDCKIAAVHIGMLANASVVS